MRLRSLEVWNWRGLAHEVIGFGDDLTLVGGPNESGKTRLYEALDAALFERYKGKCQEKQRFQSWSSAEPPIVQVDFEVAGARYRLRKQFLKGASALLENGATTWRDDDAEDRLCELLATDPMRKGPGRRADGNDGRGIWPLVWLPQGTGRRPPEEDLTPGGRARLHDVLARTVGVVTAGARGRRILDAARAEARAYFTECWNATGTYAAAAKALEAAEGRLRAATERREHVHAQADRLAQLCERLADLDRRLGERGRVRDEAAERARAVAGVRQLQAQVEARRGARDAEARRADEALAARLRREAEHCQRALDLAAATKHVEELTARLAELQPEVAQSRAAVEATEHAEQAARADEARAQRQLARRRLQEDAERARAATAQARATAGELRGVEERLARTGSVTPRDVERLRAAAEARVHADARLAAAAARVRIRVLQPTTVDGAPASPGDVAEALVTAPRIFRVGDLAEVEVLPGGAELGVLRDAARDTAAAEAALLAQLGVGDLAAAESLATERKLLAAERERLVALLRREAPAGVDALAREVARIEGVLAAAGPDDADAPDPTAAATVAATASRLLAEARARRDAATTAEHHLERDQAAGAERRAAAARGVANLEAELASGPDATALRREAESAAAALGEVLREREALAAELERLGGDRADAALRQAEQAVSALDAERGRLVEEKVGLEGELRATGGDRLHEEVLESEAAAEGGSGGARPAGPPVGSRANARRGARGSAGTRPAAAGGAAAREGAPVPRRALLQRRPAPG